jgi:hypothetical protein
MKPAHLSLRQRDEASLRELALRLYSARARRRKFFPESLFGEPAWDVLLALYGLAEGVSGLDMICENIRGPADWALRSIGYLENQGLVARDHWPRGPVVQLTDEGREVLGSYLAGLSAEFSD